MGCERTSGIRGLTVAMMALVLVAFPVAGQNLVNNGSFDDNMDGWSNIWSTVTLVYHDDVGSTLSGGSGPGCYGQGVPAVDAGASSTVVIPGLYQGEAYRTNIGILNTSGSLFNVELRLFDPNGIQVGTAVWTLKPYEQ